MSTPISQSNRIAAIDILRGIALLGILLMNIPGFSMPKYFSESFRSDSQNINFWTQAIIDVLFEGKMRALFSMIFGAGIILFTVNKENSGVSSAALFYRRMGWLIVFGLIHSHVLLWDGDILYFYGVIGMLAFLFRKMNPMHLIMAIPLVAIVEFTLSTYLYQEIREKRLAYVEVVVIQKNNQILNEDQKQVLKDWREVELDFIPNKEDVAEHTRKMKSDYAAVASYIGEDSWEGQTVYLIYAIWDPLALMLLGIALFKLGYFSLKWKISDYKKVAVVGYSTGLPLVIFNFYYNFLSSPNHAADLLYLETHSINWLELIYPVQRICLVMAHSSLILLAISSGWFVSLFNRLRAVGQMAFTNYIVQTLLCTFIFYGYGLNYYAELEYYKIYYIVFAIWALQIFYSRIWLTYFLFGPLEWMWRSLMYWKVQPFRR